MSPIKHPPGQQSAGASSLVVHAARIVDDQVGTAMAKPPVSGAVAEAGPQRGRRAALVALWALLLLAALVVRLRTFAPLEVGLDGALSMDLARSPVAEMFRFNALDVHPPLFYLALKAWMLVAGASYYQAKYLAIACSVLGTATLGATATRLRSPGAGLLSGLLLTLAPTNVLLGTTVRDFAPGLALSLLCLLLSLELRAERSWESRVRAAALLAALAAATGAALLTWYFHAAFFLLTLWLALSLSRPRRRLDVVALAVGVVASLPWYAYAVPALLGKVERGTTAFGGPPRLPSASALLDALAHGLTGQNGPGWSVATLGVWLGLCLLGAVSWPGRGSRRAAAGGRPPSKLTLGLAIGGLALGALEIAALVARWNAPEDSSRYAIALVPFAAVLQASAALSARPAVRWAGLAGTLCLVAWNEASFVRLVNGTPIDWAHDPAVATVRQQMRPGDAVIFNDRARRLRFDLGPHVGVDDYAVHSAGQVYLQAHLAEDAARTVAAAVAGHGRVWLLSAGDPPGTPPLAREALAARGFIAMHTDVEGTDLSLFELGVPDTRITPNAQFGTLARLDEARYTRRVSAEGALLVDLTWVSVRTSADAYSVFVHLEDASGKLVAQHDGEPDAGFAPTPAWKAGGVVDDRHGVPLPASLAPGDYRLFVGLYHGDQRLTLPNGENQLLLGDVTVQPPGG